MAWSPGSRATVSPGTTEMPDKTAGPPSYPHPRLVEMGKKADLVQYLHPVRCIPRRSAPNTITKGKWLPLCVRDENVVGSTTQDPWGKVRSIRSDRTARSRNSTSAKISPRPPGAAVPRLSGNATRLHRCVPPDHERQWVQDASSGN